MTTFDGWQSALLLERRLVRALRHGPPVRIGVFGAEGVQLQIEDVCVQIMCCGAGSYNVDGTTLFTAAELDSYIQYWVKKHTGQTIAFDD